MAELVRDLTRPETYPHSAEDIEVRQTHISVVFLAGRYVYKVKKPVDLGFLDFSTLEKRLHFCREEVRLNRRLAPDVYLGVVPLVEGPSGLVVDGESEGGEPVEHAVKMKRLPPDAVLLARLARGDLDESVWEALGRRIADFHAGAASGPEIDRYGHWDVVAAQARENLDQSGSHVGVHVSETVFRTLRSRLEERLRELRPLIEARVEAHVPRNTHGDLHLEHVYLFPDRPPPRDLVIIDCIEFSERFRYADPVADMAFLSMDLAFHGRRDLSERFADAYFEAAGDGEGRALLPFYVAYRSAVRAKVEGLLAAQDDVPEEERRDAGRKVRAHWLLALSELESPDRRPGLVLIGGLPGTGKSTLAEELAERGGFHVVSSDRVRKELAGLPPTTSAASSFGQGIYTPEWNDRTYDGCLSAARELVFQGERVIVDASFREEDRRRAFLDAATDWGIRSIFLECTAKPGTVRERITGGGRGASDADASIYEAAARAWEPEEAEVVRRRLAKVSTGSTVEEAVEEALRHLRANGLVG